MNMEKLHQAVDTLRLKLGEGLLACDIWGPDGLSLAGYNSQPTAVALLADVTARLHQALDQAGFPSIGRYYVMELQDDKTACVMLHRGHQWGCLIDRRKVIIGQLLMLALPKALDNLTAAIDDD